MQAPRRVSVVYGCDDSCASRSVGRMQVVHHIAGLAPSRLEYDSQEVMYPVFGTGVLEITLVTR